MLDVVDDEEELAPREVIDQRRLGITAVLEGRPDGACDGRRDLLVGAQRRE